MKKLKYYLSLIVASTLLFISCGGSAGSENEEVTILYPNWSEGVAFTYLAKVALEDKGYDVELINLEPGLIFGELSKSNSKGDVFLDAWLPNTHEDYWEDYGDKLVVLGESFSEGTTGLVVPSYVTINSIEELNANRDQFDGEIIGIGSGAGIHRNTIRAIDEYKPQRTMSGLLLPGGNHTINGIILILNTWKILKTYILPTNVQLCREEDLKRTSLKWLTSSKSLILVKSSLMV